LSTLFIVAIDLNFNHDNYHERKAGQNHNIK